MGHAPNARSGELGSILVVQVDAHLGNSGRVAMNTRPVSQRRLARTSILVISSFAIGLIAVILLTSTILSRLGGTSVPAAPAGPEPKYLERKLVDTSGFATV